MPKIKEKIIKFCPSCLSNNFSYHTYGYDYEYKTSTNKWTIVCCKRCDLLYLKNRPHTSTIKKIYPKKYYSFNYDKISSVARYGKSFLDKLKFKKFLPKINNQNLKFLDIGCGDGRYLELMHKKFNLKKSNCHGLDFKNYKLIELKKKGYNITHKNFSEYTPKKKFDIITMFHVIEHVESPRNYLKKIKRLLSKNGLLILETPNYDSIDARIFKKSFWGGYHIPRHFVVFNDINLVKLSKKFGYLLKKKIFLTGHYFWMMSFFNKFGQNSAYIKKIFDPFNFFGLPLLIMFTLFDITRSWFGFKTSTIMVVLKKK